MKLKLVLVTVLLTLAQFAAASINLEPPEALLKKAAIDRQQLRDAVFAIELQLPEMRSQTVFESYFFILDELKVDSDKLGLDDLFPDAVKGLATKMAAFGVKWIDLNSIDQKKLGYYLKWMDVEAVSDLLAYANYFSKKYTAVDQLKVLATNIDFIIEQTQVLIKDRFDLAVGFRELSSSIAVKFLLDPNQTLEEKKFWANKIYTSQALSFYTDQIQKDIYQLNESNKNQIHETLIAINLCFQISARLIDSPTSFTYERISELVLEVIKRSFELQELLSSLEITNLIQPLGPKQMQSLSSYLISAPDAIIYKNSENLITIGHTLLNSLKAANLITEATSLNTFLEKISAAILVNQLEAEGTYQLADKDGNKWKFTILSHRPFELIAAFANDSWSITKSFYSVKYSAETNTFVAKESVNEFDNSTSHSVAIFSIGKDHSITFSDLYGSEATKSLVGKLVEPLAPLEFSQNLNPAQVKTYQGEVTFNSSQKAVKVELTVQSDGLNTTARLTDQYGLIYEFTSGYINDKNQISLTTGRLVTTWAQLRGTLKNEEISAEIIVGGRGLIAKKLILKNKGSIPQK